MYVVRTWQRAEGRRFLKRLMAGPELFCGGKHDYVVYERSVSLNQRKLFKHTRAHSYEALSILCVYVVRIPLMKLKYLFYRMNCGDCEWCGRRHCHPPPTLTHVQSWTEENPIRFLKIDQTISIFRFIIRSTIPWTWAYALGIYIYYFFF